ncbi:Presequence translocated-associated motor subunit pam17, mitochondrial [Lachnellula hyalina]|uniref:Presequence translocated-associated motor subunit PAM17 n=1 Tax=Lachnellula hyalina TaxID=1316788 RepID=A0A8H8QSU6_9HELO|nr:Presequence translocated-associated motor subunit pam17, mitochondrial [Lachnellula hyalina]TVY22148.1 Presequence translocated-associated motor subunit pam17, mitochondrial [Lachnellula hyalina]
MLYTAPTLRTAAMSCRLQPTLLTTSSFHTSTHTPLRVQDSSSTCRVPLSKRHVSFKKPAICTSSISVRYASSVPNPSPITAASTNTTRPAKPSPRPSDQERLSWNTFFTLRKTRRRYQLGSSITTSLTSFVGGAEILLASDMDSLVSQFPLDPFITLGIITFLCGGAGWLVGPIVGTSMFNWRNRGVRDQMDQKEREFYRRIKKFRVDPSASSAANPVPDYYGEKIGSVADYRQWLKDQRAFNRKRSHFV